MWQTKRRMRRDLAALRVERDQAKRDLAKAVAEHDDQLRQLGRQLADRDEHIDKVEAHRDNLRAQLDAATTEVGNIRRVLAHTAGSHQTIVPVVHLQPAETRVDLVKRGAQ